MAPKPQWIDPATGEAPSSLVFTGLVPGTPSPARPLELWNDRDAAGADVLRHLRVVALARRSVGEDFVAEGLPVLDTRAVQLRVTGGLGGSTPAPTGWRPLGAGAFLDLSPLPAGTGFALELRVALSPGASSDAVTVRLRLDSRRSVPLARGVFEVAGSGVLHGLGDRTRSHLLHLGGPVEADGTDSVTLPDAVWIHRGRPWAKWTTPLALDAADGDGQPLAAGQGYVASVSLGAGEVNVTKGPAAALPLTPDDRPLPPEGELRWLWIARAEDGVIEAGDVEDVAVLDGFGLRETAGLTLTLGAGQALVGGHHVRADVAEAVDVPDEASSTVSLLPDGSLAVTASAEDGDAPPDPAALDLWRVDTEAGAVTAVRDLRRWLGGRVLTASLTLRAPAAGDVAVWGHVGERPLDLLPGAIRLDLHDAPGELGHTAGAWALDLESRAPGGEWTSLFPSAGLPDVEAKGRLARLDFDGTASEPLPEIRSLEPRSLLRARVLELPTGGTPASGLTVSLRLWEAR